MDRVKRQTEFQGEIQTTTRMDGVERGRVGKKRLNLIMGQRYGF